MESIYLSGAEDVRSAANTIRNAAEETRSAASNMDEAFRLHQRFLDDWLFRFTDVLTVLTDALAKKEESPTVPVVTHRCKSRCSDPEDPYSKTIPCRGYCTSDGKFHDTCGEPCSFVMDTVTD